MTRSSLLTRRKLESLVGVLQFASITDRVLLTRTKDFSRLMKSRAKPRLRDQKLPVPAKLKVLLRPWKKMSSFAKQVPLVLPPVTHILHSDASTAGWEGHDGKETVSGSWSPTLASCHINFLELMAAFLVLRRLAPQKSHVKLMLDNSAAVACLKRGGSRSPPLNLVVLAINRLMEKRKVFLSAEHIVGTSNVLADALSRDRVVSTEWSLSRNTFLSIFRNHPDLEVDIFVTRRNHQLPQYVSPFQDPGAVAVDAFKVNWNRWKAIFLFPPTPQISKVLDRLKSFRGKAVLVAPYWPTSHFFIPLRTAARSWTPLRSPVLSQTVGGRKVFNDYCRTLNLHVWIFSTSLITPRIF